MNDAPTLIEEERLWQAGYSMIAGLDEAGRGSLAGPLVAAAVILSPQARYPWMEMVRDSKLLPAARRQRLFEAIRAEALAVSWAVASVELVDQFDVLGATKWAMGEAIRGFEPGPEYLLIDALSLPGTFLPQKALIKGDRTCLSIACASIVAKVVRDGIMEQLDGEYPGYGLARHKGYGTEDHLAALRQVGPSPVHRRSFAPVRMLLDGATQGMLMDGVPKTSSWSRVRLGQEGERMARGFLEGQGYRIRETNFRSAEGEIDIVAEHQDCLVLVEVRTRRSGRFGSAKESLSPAKKGRLIQLAHAYAQVNSDIPAQWRIDVVAIDFGPDGAKLELIPNAVGEE